MMAAKICGIIHIVALGILRELTENARKIRRTSGLFRRRLINMSLSNLLLKIHVTWARKCYARMHELPPVSNEIISSDKKSLLHVILIDPKKSWRAGGRGNVNL